MKLIAKIALGLATLGLPLSAYASARTSSNQSTTSVSPPEPRVSADRARAIALAAAVGGAIVSQEYENEDGSWRWSFDIRQNGRIHEIGVDGTSGKIVENKWESAQDEADEAD